ncbi:transcriptional regulator [Christensenellaceae bacterium]|nr:transcriptional regulator [Christensenellaceae bacterium]BDF60291.1 transcriptional regulator [Christensenellaceae bacterium]
MAKQETLSDKNGMRDGENAKTPLYQVVKERLMHDFGTLPYYSTFPSEREICETYEVSRPTVRTALDLLEQEKKIIRMPRKGAFFVGNKPHVDHQLAAATGFYNDVKMQGRNTTSKVLFQNIDRAPADVAERLGIGNGEPVFRLERLRYLDGMVYSLTNSYLPIEYLQDLIKVDFTERSLYDTLSEQGVVPYRGFQSLTFAGANAYEAMHLDIEKGTPLSVLGSLMYTEDGRLIEFVIVKSEAYKTRYEMTVYHDNQK